ncbi:hypothetical protein B484DRAFT_444173 [Ochromonadaceae sp. CCMP2298]|nr:hypothetical protein B484DRAFT_444173 [Ochromonadaceae sp. CCMP2298]
MIWVLARCVAGLLCVVALTHSLNLNPFTRGHVQVKSSVKSFTDPCADGRCKMFRSSPEIRKVVKKYLSTKMMDGVVDECDAESRVFCDRGKIFQILNQVIPPVRHDDVSAEVDNLITKFGDRFYLEPREFTSKILMDNEIWKNAGETVVKEIVYLDNKYHEISQGKPYMSQLCIDILESSLAEDESPILHLSTEEVCTASQIINTLNSATCEGDHSVQPNPVTEYGHLAFLHDKFKLHDVYGNPTLLQFISDRTSSREQVQLDFLNGPLLGAADKKASA